MRRLELTLSLRRHEKRWWCQYLLVGNNEEQMRLRLRERELHQLKG